jgi:Fe-S oxidoreductase
MASLHEEIQARTPIVVLEPSCASVLRDELENLFPEDGHARTLSESTFLLSEFLTSPRALDYRLPELRRRALVQGHCHHKAVMRMDAEQQVFSKMGLEAEVLASGCCGMAGGFGYEKGEKHDVSLAVGERVLLPAVRSASDDTLILADGFSCQEQIAQTTGRGALHLAQAMAMAIEHGPGGIAGPFPERSIREARKTAQRRSMLRAGVALMALGLAVGLAARRRRS